MSLHVDRYAYTGAGDSGAPLLMIHGWGMHGGMWRAAAEKLAQHFEVLTVDLPGHGFSKKNVGWVERSDTHHVPNVVGDGYRCAVPILYRACSIADCLTLLQPILRDIVDALSAQFKTPLNVCGWSLGGLVALSWAMRHPQQVQRLMLVASTPCFVRRADWNHAMRPELLLEFSVALQKNYAMTLKRFLALQLRGSEKERELLAIMRETLFNRGEPDLNALQSGLAILRDSDLRSALPSITQPTLIVAGERDALVPLYASQYMAQHMPAAELVSIKGAAHTPFLSHPDEFVKHLVKFLHG